MNQRGETIVTVLFAVFLTAMGVIGYAASGFDPKAKTALMSGGGSGMILLVLAWLGSRDIAWIRWVGRVGALVVVFLLSGVFTWRVTMALLEHGTEAWALYKPLVIGSMQVVALVTLGILATLRAGANR